VTYANFGSADVSKELRSGNGEGVYWLVLVVIEGRGGEWADCFGVSKIFIWDRGDLRSRVRAHGCGCTRLGHETSLFSLEHHF
jgi:hypothetical protein